MLSRITARRARAVRCSRGATRSADASTGCWARSIRLTFASLFLKAYAASSSMEWRGLQSTEYRVEVAKWSTGTRLDFRSATVIRLGYD